MKKYKILFIDEESEQQEAFLDYIEGSVRKAEIEPLISFPEQEIENMIDKVISINPDIVISDFMLNDSIREVGHSVEYNGAELIMNFLKIREGFPCFVMTALDDEAIRTIDDVNVVYVKGIMHSDYDTQNARADFIDRIISQAQHYQSKIVIAEEELTELLKLRHLDTLSAIDEQRLIKLDSFLENAIDGRSKIPDEFKTISNNNKLERLIESVDKLIDEIDGESD